MKIYEALVRVYADGKQKVVFKDLHEATSFYSELLLIKKIREKGMHNRGAFIYLLVLPFGTYITRYENGIKDGKTWYISAEMVNLLQEMLEVVRDA